MPRKPNDLTGRRFGMWLVLEREGTTEYGHPHWRCRCDCGNTSLVRTTNLLSGLSQRCRPCGSLRATEARWSTKEEWES